MNVVMYVILVLMFIGIILLAFEFGYLCRYEDEKAMKRKKLKKVRICGIPHKIKYKDVIDEDVEGIVNGYIEYSKATIYLKKGLPPAFERETLVHEIVHGMLVHTGRQSLSYDEEFVQCLANAINQTFDIKEF